VRTEAKVNELSVESPLARLFASGSVCFLTGRISSDTGFEPLAEQQSVYGVALKKTSALYVSGMTAYVTSAVLICFAFILFWFSLSSGLSLALNPALADAEMAIVHRLEQPQRERFSKATACSNSGQVETAYGGQTMQQMKHRLIKLLLVKKLVSMQKKQQKFLSKLASSALM